MTRETTTVGYSVRQVDQHGSVLDVAHFRLEHEAREFFYEVVADRPRNIRVTLTSTTVDELARGRGLGE